MTVDNKIRVLVSKIGLDGHDKGAMLIASILRDAGMEVIYTGLRRTPTQCVNTALQEDVDVIGLSILSGSHLTLASKVIELMKAKGVNDKKLIVGGVIPDEDIPKLKDMGVDAVFTQSSTYSEMIDYIKKATGKEAAST